MSHSLPGQEHLHQPFRVEGRCNSAPNGRYLSKDIIPRSSIVAHICARFFWWSFLLDLLVWICIQKTYTLKTLWFLRFGIFGQHEPCIYSTCMHKPTCTHTDKHYFLFSTFARDHLRSVWISCLTAQAPVVQAPFSIQHGKPQGTGLLLNGPND